MAHALFNSGSDGRVRVHQEHGGRNTHRQLSLETISSDGASLGHAVPGRLEASRACEGHCSKIKFTLLPHRPSTHPEPQSHDQPILRCASCCSMQEQQQRSCHTGLLLRHLGHTPHHTQHPYACPSNMPRSGAQTTHAGDHLLQLRPR